MSVAILKCSLGVQVPLPHPYVGNHYSRISTPHVIDKNLISLSTQTGGWGTLREAGILNTRVPREPFPAGPGASDLETMPWGEGSTEALEDYWVPERALIPAPCGPAEARWRGQGLGGGLAGVGGEHRASPVELWLTLQASARKGAGTDILRNPQKPHLSFLTTGLRARIVAWLPPCCKGQPFFP